MKMKRRRTLWGTLTFLAAFHVAVLFAGFFAPYNFADQNRDLAFAPPTRVHFIDSHRKFHLRPFVYGMRYAPQAPSGFAPDLSGMYPVRFFARGTPYKIAGVFLSSLHLFEVDEPGRIFLWAATATGATSFRVSFMEDSFRFSQVCWPRRFRLAWGSRLERWPGFTAGGSTKC